MGGHCPCQPTAHHHASFLFLSWSSSFCPLGKAELPALPFLFFGFRFVRAGHLGKGNGAWVCLGQRPSRTYGWDCSGSTQPTEDSGPRWATQMSLFSPSKLGTDVN